MKATKILQQVREKKREKGSSILSSVGPKSSKVIYLFVKHNYSKLTESIFSTESKENILQSTFHTLKKLVSFCRIILPSFELNFYFV